MTRGTDQPRGSRASRSLAVFAALTVVLAACGDDDEATTATTTAEAPATTAEAPATTAATEETTAGTEAAGGEAPDLDANGDDALASVLSSLKLGGSVALALVGNAVLIPVALFYLLMEWHRFMAQLTSLVPPHLREAVPR